MKQQRPIWPVAVLSLMALATLLWLGFWQVGRLAEKQDLISSIDARMAAPAISLTQALVQDGKGEDVEFEKVWVQGSFIGKPLQKITIYNGGAAQDIIQAFVTTENDVLLVLRGAVPEGATMTDQVPQNVRVTGILRRHAGGQGVFDNDNNEAENRWYWWDTPAMLAQFQLPEGARPLTWILHRLPENDKTAPFAALPKAELRNNHLGYAITWFGLAAALVAMVAVLALRRRT